MRKAADVLEDAIKKYRPQAIKNDVWLAELSCQLGETYLKIGDHEKALEAFREAEDTTPGQPKTFQELARCYESIGMADEAIRVYEKLCGMVPGWKDHFVWCIGRIHFQNKRCKQAVACFEQIRDSSLVNLYTRSGSEPFRLYYTWAMAAKKLRRRARAIELLWRDVEEYPDHGQGWLSLGELLFDKQDIAAALYVFKKGAKFPDVQADCLFQIGFIYWLANDKARAQRMLSKLRGVDSDKAVLLNVITQRTLSETLAETTRTRDKSKPTATIGSKRKIRSKRPR